MADDKCAMCGGLGWILDGIPGRPDPVMAEFIQCVIPDCAASGRPVQSVCFKGVEFLHVARHPAHGHVMSVSGPAPALNQIRERPDA